MSGWFMFSCTSLPPELTPAPEGRKRYSDIFQSLDNLEISLGNV